MRKLGLALASAATIATLGLAAPAYAAHELPPGDTGSPIAEPLQATGARLADTGLQNVGLTLAGTTLNTQIRAAVYDAGGGLLDFVYQITNLGTSNTSVEELSFANFDNFEVTGVWQQLSAFDVFVAGVEEADSAERNPNGTALGINFDTNHFSGTDTDAGADFLVNPGETSAIFQFRVRAPTFVPGTFTAQNGIGVTGLGYAPAIPEPATWAMMLLGFGAVGVAFRRRRREQPLLQLA